MEPFVIDPANLGDPAALVGAVIAEEVRAGGRKAFSKGHVVAAADLATVALLDRPVHAVRLGPGEVHENEAALRLARAAAPGLEIRGPVQSRCNLLATGKGLLRIDRERLTALNRLPGVAVFTLLDRLCVLPGRIVAGAKITPVAMPEATLREAEAMARGRPVIRVEPFVPLRVGVILTEALEGRVRQRFEATLDLKLGWYGATQLRLEQVPREAPAVAAEMARMIDDGATLVLAVGGNTIDPLDPTLLALDLIDARLVRFGAPAHPGSMFWLAYRGEVPIFNLASCSMYSKSTIADLVLSWIMTGERVTNDTLAELGFGGLLDRGMGFRFPPYDTEVADDESEE